MNVLILDSRCSVLSVDKFGIGICRLHLKAKSTIYYMISVPQSSDSKPAYWYSLVPGKTSSKNNNF